MEKMIVKKAQKILKKNWTGAYTKPAPRLYPHQWSWDSGFIAIGYSHYYQKRAQRELLSLFNGQWKNGMLPHIVYHTQDSSYFPDAGFWEINRSKDAIESPATSGITQPPIHATAALRIYQSASDKTIAFDFLKEIFPKLLKQHRYLYNKRDPNDEGLVFIVHPWESGMDNSPTWDVPLSRLKFSKEEIPTYKRTDILEVPRKERPTDEDYNRYIYLIESLKRLDYNDGRISRHHTFLVQDVLFNSILQRSNIDLLMISNILNEDGQEINAWKERTQQAMNEKLWDEDAETYYSVDLIAGKRLKVETASSFIPLYGLIPSKDRARRLLERLNNECFCKLDENCYAVPSYDRCGVGFGVGNYWRGPIWINIDWLIYQGLIGYGFKEYAEYLRNSIIGLVKDSGFLEYFDPFEGGGYGTDQFSWSAALLIDIMSSESKGEYIGARKMERESII